SDPKRNQPASGVGRSWPSEDQGANRQGERRHAKENVRWDVPHANAARCSSLPVFPTPHRLAVAKLDAQEVTVASETAHVKLRLKDQRYKEAAQDRDQAQRCSNFRSGLCRAYSLEIVRFKRVSEQPSDRSCKRGHVE